MATAAEVKALAETIKGEVDKFGPAVDALEAAVTAALAKLPSVPPDAGRHRQRILDDDINLRQRTGRDCRRCGRRGRGCGPGPVNGRLGRRISATHRGL